MSKEKLGSHDQDLLNIPLLEMVKYDNAMVKEVCMNVDKVTMDNLTVNNQIPKLLKRRKHAKRPFRRRNRTKKKVDDQLPIASSDVSKLVLDSTYQTSVQHEHCFPLVLLNKSDLIDRCKQVLHESNLERTDATDTALQQYIPTQCDHVLKTSQQLEIEIHNSSLNNNFCQKETQTKAQENHLKSDIQNFNIDKELKEARSKSVSMNPVANSYTETNNMFKEPFKDKLLLDPNLVIGLQNPTEKTHLQRHQYRTTSSKASRKRQLSRVFFVGEADLPSKICCASNHLSREMYRRCRNRNDNWQNSYIRRSYRNRADYKVGEVKRENNQIRHVHQVENLNNMISSTFAKRSKKFVKTSHISRYMILPLSGNEEIRLLDTHGRQLDLSKDEFVVDDSSLQLDKYDRKFPVFSPRENDLCEICQSLGICSSNCQISARKKQPQHFIDTYPTFSLNNQATRIRKYKNITDSINLSKRCMNSTDSINLSKRYMNNTDSFNLNKRCINNIDSINLSKRYMNSTDSFNLNKRYINSTDSINLCNNNNNNNSRKRNLKRKFVSSRQEISSCLCDAKVDKELPDYQATNCSALCQVHKLLDETKANCELSKEGMSTYSEDHTLINASHYEDKYSQLSMDQRFRYNNDGKIIPISFVKTNSVNNGTSLWEIKATTDTVTTEFKKKLSELPRRLKKLQNNKNAFFNVKKFKQNKNRGCLYRSSVFRKCPKFCSAIFHAISSSRSSKFKNATYNNKKHRYSPGYKNKRQIAKKKLLAPLKSESLLSMRYISTRKHRRFPCQDRSRRNRICLLPNHFLEGHSKLETSCKKESTSERCRYVPMPSDNLSSNHLIFLQQNKKSTQSDLDYKAGNNKLSNLCSATKKNMTYYNNNNTNGICGEWNTTQTPALTGTLASFCYISEPPSAPATASTYRTRVHSDKQNYSSCLAEETDGFGYSNNYSCRDGISSVKSGSLLSSTEVGEELEQELMSLVDEYSRARLNMVANHREDSICSRAQSRISVNYSVNNPHIKNIEYLRSVNTESERDCQWKKACQVQDLKRRNIPEPVRDYSTHNIKVLPTFCNPSCSLNKDYGSKVKQSEEFAPFQTGEPSQIAQENLIDNGMMFKPASTNLTYRDPKENEFLVKYRQEQNGNNPLEDNDIPFCPTTENYWQTTAVEPVSNHFQSEIHPNDICSNTHSNTKWSNSWQQSDSRSSSERIPFDGHHVQDRDFNRTTTVDNREYVTNFPELYNNLNTMWKRSEKKINRQFRSLDKSVNSRLNSMQNFMENKLEGECRLNEGGERSDQHKRETQVHINPRKQIKEHVGTIHLSTKQKQTRNGMHGFPLDISKYKRKHIHLEAESDQDNKEDEHISKQSSETFPTIKFNEITQKSKINLNGYYPQNDSVFKYPMNGSKSDGREKKRDQVRKIRSYSPVGKRKRYSDTSNVEADKSSSHAVANTSKNVTTFANITKKNSNKSSSPRYKSVRFLHEPNTPHQDLFANNKGKEISRLFQRLKHSRSCRRRHVMNGSICCNKCLPSPPVESNLLPKVNKSQDNNFVKRKQSRRQNLRSRKLRPKQKQRTVQRGRFKVTLPGWYRSRTRGRRR